MESKWIVSDFPLIGTFIILHFLLINTAEQIMNSKECKPNSAIQLPLKYMLWIRYSLRQRNLCNQILNKMDFKNADLEGADFRQTELQKSQFQGANLSGANFSEAMLINAQLQGKKTNLKYVNMEKAILDNANLQDAYLKNANLKEASLKSTNFQGAILDYADLSKVDLKYSINLTQGQLTYAKLCHTKLPQYIKNLDGNRDCL